MLISIDLSVQHWNLCGSFELLYMRPVCLQVTVALVDIKPKISYTSIPQRVPHAFMLAKVTNSSPYTFLAGETSIFLDNTFVGKVSQGLPVLGLSFGVNKLGFSTNHF